MKKKELVSLIQNKVEELVELLDRAENIFDDNSRMEDLLEQNNKYIFRLRSEMNGWRKIAHAHMEKEKK